MNLTSETNNIERLAQSILNGGTSQIPMSHSPSGDTKTHTEEIKPGQATTNKTRRRTGRGKIARLPYKIREELNRRLLDGETSTIIIPWINAIPKVRAILESEFAGKPVCKQNISNWRKIGYNEWLNRGEAAEALGRFGEDALDLRQNIGEDICDKISLWLTTRYLLAMKKMEGKDGLHDWKLMHKFCSDLVALRRGDHSAKRLALMREKNLHAQLLREETH